MARPSERLAWMALSHVSFLTPREKLLLSDMLGGPEEILRLGLKDLAGMLGRRFTTGAWQPGRLVERAEECEKRLTREGLGCIFYKDRAYPPQLREIYDPPAMLYFRGRLPDNGKALIGIVGTRYPTGAARKAAFALGFELAAGDIGVVSGLARGIDSDAHDGCVEARGFSVAVLGSGIDMICPAASRPLARALLEADGVIFSEYPPGTPPRRYSFPARNRIISGLCRTVVVVQAPERSGALITAEYALEQGRDLMVHGAGIEGSAGAGTRRLAESGAPVVSGARDILSEWGMETPPTRIAVGETAEDIPRLVRGEISGSCARRSGLTLWRG
jgi:DNA processing protein